MMHGPTHIKKNRAVFPLVSDESSVYVWCEKYFALSAVERVSAYCFCLEAE